jgi:predicted phage tail protein
MNTAKALIAGVVVTVGLLASSFAFEGVAQLLGPEEEEHVEDDAHADEGEAGDEPEADEVDLGGDEDGEG